jgi:SAM-dependent methyltransferase
MAEFLVTQERVRKSFSDDVQRARNLAKIAELFKLSRDQFINILRGKTIIDVGCGFMGLAVDLALRNVDCTVYSIDPLLDDPDFEKRQKEAITFDSEGFYQEFSLQQRECARVDALRRAYPYYANHMPDFEDNKFNLLTDICAAFAYFDFETGRKRELAAFLKTIEEERRVLRPGAPMYVMDFYTYKTNDLNNANWKERELIKMGLKYAPVGEDIVAGNSLGTNSLIIYNEIRIP